MTFLVILFAILLFSLIIFIHELGHFISARIFKVTVHEFAIGMGPAIFSWSGKGTSSTKYSIRCIPIGGYCKMEGEDGDSDSDGSFSSKSKFARFVILASGAFMNIVLGFLISIVVVIATSGNGIATTTIEELVPNSPVSAYIKPGDKIVEINGHSINIKQEIAFALAMGDSETEKTCKAFADRMLKNFEDIMYNEQIGFIHFLLLPLFICLNLVAAHLM